MRNNKVQFAVVREDPMVEAELVRLTQGKKRAVNCFWRMHCANIASTVSRLAYHAR